MILPPIYISAISISHSSRAKAVEVICQVASDADSISIVIVTCSVALLILYMMQLSVIYLLSFDEM